MKKPKKVKEKIRVLHIEAAVPQSVINEIKLVANNLIDQHKATKPIKRVQKISNAQLAKMKKAGRAALAVLGKINNVLSNEYSRLDSYTDQELNDADQKWLGQQIDRLFKLGDDLNLDLAD